ncbi:MAG: indole-3-glycerol phosphate synthase TrpC [Chloroflexi bacterium]|nr:indole-3-glycerol phosphate synthase TrpC [Chloroflexota bacterium]
MILDEIVRYKTEELKRREERAPLAQVREAALRGEKLRDFEAALRKPGLSLIAEVKKASPSKGLLSRDFDPARLAKAYVENGASAISVLTDERFFQGCLEDLATAKRVSGESLAPPLPVLRKDFVFSPYQVYETRAWAADALLLIVAILDDRRLVQLRELAERLGMRCLVEAHDAGEVDRAVASGAKIIGINNRDLQTFKVDLETTATLRSRIPNGCTVVSESGIHTRGDTRRLVEWGIDAALVGEALVTAGEIGPAIKDLLDLGES